MIGERKTSRKDMQMLDGQNFTERPRKKARKHRRFDLRERCECYVRVRRVRRRDTMLHDLRRGHGLRLCGANITAETGRWAVPRCLGFNCEKKCQQTEAECKRSAPIGRGSGEPSRHNGSLSRNRRGSASVAQARAFYRSRGSPVGRNANPSKSVPDASTSLIFS